MPKVVVTAQVADPVKWETSFRTHGELFRSQTVTSPVQFGVADGNHAAVCLEPDDLDTFLASMNSPETAEAMKVDGVKRDTVKIFVLDKELEV